MLGKLTKIQNLWFVATNYKNGGWINHIRLHPDDITRLEADLFDGMRVEVEIVDSSDEKYPLYSKITENWYRWHEIEREYHSDQYPPFGGPFTDSLAPWEWLKKYYISPERK